MPKSDMHFVPKGWGSELWIHNDELYCGKKMILHKGKRCSLHYHKLKTETFYVQSGKVQIELKYPDGNEEVLILSAGDTIHLPQGTLHRFTGLEDAEIFEFSTQHFDEDSIRVEKGD
jgi:quercetin dioxygenase-like cupin family protein